MAVATDPSVDFCPLTSFARGETPPDLGPAAGGYDSVPVWPRPRDPVPHERERVASRALASCTLLGGAGRSAEAAEPVPLELTRTFTSRSTQSPRVPALARDRHSDSGMSGHSFGGARERSTCAATSATARRATDQMIATAPQAAPGPGHFIRIQDGERPKPCCHRGAGPGRQPEREPAPARHCRHSHHCQRQRHLSRDPVNGAGVTHTVPVHRGHAHRVAQPGPSRYGGDGRQGQEAGAPPRRAARVGADGALASPATSPNTTARMPTV